MKEKWTKITILREIQVYSSKNKKSILICLPNLRKSSIDIRAPANKEIRNFIVILSLTIVEENHVVEN